jgi:hypothetical protein
MNKYDQAQPDVFPERVQFKSSTAKIYRNRHRQNFRYEVRHHDNNGVLERATFEDYLAAKRHAEAIVRQMARGGLDMVALRGRDRFVYETALERLRPLEVSFRPQ